MTRKYNNRNAVIVSILACASLSACANSSFVDLGLDRKNNVMDAQFAATAKSTPVISSGEGTHIYTNYLDEIGKPVPPTSSMERLTK